MSGWTAVSKARKLAWDIKCLVIQAFGKSSHELMDFLLSSSVRWTTLSLSYPKLLFLATLSAKVTPALPALWPRVPVQAQPGLWKVCCLCLRSPRACQLPPAPMQQCVISRGGITLYSPAYRLLATNSTFPERVSPSLAKRGVWRRHRTWYQWVRGSVGAVDSQTVTLQGKKKSWNPITFQACVNVSDWRLRLMNNFHWFWLMEPF